MRETKLKASTDRRLSGREIESTGSEDASLAWHYATRKPIDSSCVGWRGNHGIHVESICENRDSQLHHSLVIAMRAGNDQHRISRSINN